MHPLTDYIPSLIFVAAAFAMPSEPEKTDVEIEDVIPAKVEEPVIQETESTPEIVEAAQEQERIAQSVSGRTTNQASVGSPHFASQVAALELP